MLSPDLAPLVTVIVVVVFANAINLIDGLDGLAAGHRDHRRHRAVPLLGPAVQGRLPRGRQHRAADRGDRGRRSASGFLPCNFNPARIFMGDAGALFLGLLLATTTITIGGHADYQYPGTTYFFYAPLFIPIVILGVPIIDTAFSFVRRAVRGQLVRGRGQGPPPSPADAPRPRPPPHRRASSGSGPRCCRGSRCSRPTPSSGNLNALVPIGVLALALVLYALFAPGRPLGTGRRRRGPGRRGRGAVVRARSVVDLESRRRNVRSARGRRRPPADRRTAATRRPRRPPGGEIGR